MARAGSRSGSNSPYAAGQQNFDYNVLFNEHSTSHLSQIFDVVENFVRIAAFNLDTANVLTIEQVTGQGAGEVFADYCPINGPATLYYNTIEDQRTSFILERPGRYRLRLDGPGLGLIVAFQIGFQMENEASQDIADALFAVLKEFKPTPCTIGQQIPTGTYDGNILGVDAQLCMIKFPPPPPNPCTFGPIIPTATPPCGVTSIGKDAEGCLIGFPLTGINNTAAGVNFVPTVTITPTVTCNQVQNNVNVSGDAGNQITIHHDGIFAPPAGAPPAPPTACSLGAVIPFGNPTHLIGMDASGCLVKFTLVPGDGITITTDLVNNQIIITNQCFPCGVAPPTITGNLCIVTAPSNLSVPCDDPPGSEHYNETLFFQMNSVTGGTGPYTYDWSHFSGTATWGATLGGTPSQTVTPSGNHLTVSCDLTGANPASSETFHYAITPGSYVEVTDSAAATQRWYFQSLNVAGNCSAVHTVPVSGQTYDAGITCTTAPCTPDSADFTLVQNFDQAGSPTSGLNGVGGTVSVDGLNSSVCCGGSFTLSGGISVTITDPLNTMGGGTTYTSPVSDINVFPNVLDPGGGPDTDWPASNVPVSNGTSWPFLNPCNPAAGHGPHAGAGHNMTLDITFNYFIPSALFSDGVAHTVTIATTGVTLIAHLGEYASGAGSSPCCENEIDTPITDEVVHKTFGP